jgi:hypothetical protein
MNETGSFYKLAYSSYLSFSFTTILFKHIIIEMHKMENGFFISLKHVTLLMLSADDNWQIVGLK